MLERRPARLGDASRLLAGLTLKLHPDPEVYGPTAARLLGRARLALLAGSLAAALLAAASGSPHAAVAAALLAILAYAAPALWRRVLGSMIDREVPAVLAYMLPFAAVTGYIADLVAGLAESRAFRWARLEGERMRLLLSLGYDPVTALKILVETTPSTALRDALMDYVYVQRVGASKSSLALVLLRSALESVRSQWRGYQQIASLVADATVTVVVASALVAPLAAFAGDAGLAALAALSPVVAAPLGVALLLAFRPSMGDARPPAAVFIVFAAAPLALALLALTLGPWKALALGAALAAALEYLARLYEDRARRAVNALKMAAEAARYGQDYHELLARAESLATGFVKAFIEASSRAGRIGVGEALDYVYRVVMEARSQAASLRGHAIALAAIAAATPAIVVTVLEVISALSRAAGPFMPVNADFTWVEGLVVATAPLLAVPAAVLARPWLPSLAPGLAALLVAAAAQELAPQLAARLLAGG